MKKEAKKFERVIVGNLHWSHEYHRELLSKGYVLECMNDVNRTYTLLEVLEKRKEREC